MQEDTPVGSALAGGSPTAPPTAPAADADAARLRELGYEPELRRGLGVFGNVAMGFATISPVVGLYAVALIGTMVAGPAWVWALPVCLLGQCLLLVVYSELASQFPVSAGAYQWTRRLIGPSYAWLNGWLALFGALVANTTIAYLAAPWVLSVAGLAPTTARTTAVAAGFVILCSLLNGLGVDVLRRALALGVAAEAVASVLVGFALLLVFRQQPWSLLFDSLGAQSLSGGSFTTAFITAVAVGGWAFIGFDACVATAEETRDAARHVPRAVWIALLSVGAMVIVNAVATELAHPDPAAVVAGKDADPVSTAVAASFGSWSAKPFAVVVVIAFLACGLAAQGACARNLYSIARDDVLPGSRQLKRVSGRQVPVVALSVVTVVGLAGLVFTLNGSAVAALLTFGSAGLYLQFLLIAVAALIARLRGTWVPSGHVRLGRLGTVANVLAVLWLGFELINIAWPRSVLAPPGAPWWVVWAAPLVTAIALAVGLVYLAVARPQDKVRRSAAFADSGPAV
ncbi:APC family permease [Streptomyces sp. NPDC004069]